MKRPIIVRPEAIHCVILPFRYACLASDHTFATSCDQ